MTSSACSYNCCYFPFSWLSITNRPVFTPNEHVWWQPSLGWSLWPASPIHVSRHGAWDCGWKGIRLYAHALFLCSTDMSTSASETDNPLYESQVTVNWVTTHHCTWEMLIFNIQELTVEMFHEAVVSSDDEEEHAAVEQVYESQVSIIIHETHKSYHAQFRWTTPLLVDHAHSVLMTPLQCLLSKHAYSQWFSCPASLSFC